MTHLPIGRLIHLYFRLPHKLFDGLLLLDVKGFQEGFIASERVESMIYNQKCLLLRIGKIVTLHTRIEVQEIILAPGVNDGDRTVDHYLVDSRHPFRALHSSKKVGFKAYLERTCEYLSLLILTIP